MPDEDDDGDDYHAAAEQDYLRLRRAAVEGLARARGDEHAVRAAIAAYLRDGLSVTDVYHSPQALTDYFCVDTPSILDDAGYTPAEADRATELFDEIMPLLFKETRPAD